MSKGGGGSVAFQDFTLPAHHERLATSINKVRTQAFGKQQGGNYAHTTRLCRFCLLRDLRGYGLCRHRGVGAGGAGGRTPGVTRKILSKTDGPTAGYETLLVEAEIEAGVPVGRHTHPGVESAYVLEGGFELPIEGQETRMLKPGDGFQIPPNTPHAGGKPGTAKSKILITYVVEKGKPLASPV
jgi:quercetin dioxygenase-like cupin family protein